MQKNNLHRRNHNLRIHNSEAASEKGTITQKITDLIKRITIAIDAKLFGADYSHKKEKNDKIAEKIYKDENIYFIFFFIAIIAKLAKIDGQVNSLEEKTFFSEFVKLGYKIPDIKNFFKAAVDDQQDAEYYTKKIKLLYNNKKEFFETLLSAMIKIAECDGPINNLEMGFLRRIALDFKINTSMFEKLFYHVLSPVIVRDPYVFLGVSKSISKNDLNFHYRKLAKKYHPDNYIKYEGICDEYKQVMQNKFDLYTKAYMKIKSKIKD